MDLLLPVCDRWFPSATGTHLWRDSVAAPQEP
jgi:hypothetical protein